MTDKISLDRIELLHPAIKDKVRKAFLNAGERLTGRATLRLAYTLRTFKEQDNLFALGRTVIKDAKGNKVRIVTNSKGGQSFHNYGLAWDIVLIIDGKEASWDTLKDFDGDRVADWMEVVDEFKKIGAEWGGDWKGSLGDKPHFQFSFGYTWKQLLEKHNNEDFLLNSTYVKL